MKAYQQLTLTALIVCSICFVTSCQKTQNASAEQLATQYGGNPQDPSAEAGQPDAGALTGPVAPQEQEQSRNRFGFAAVENPVKPLRRDTSNHMPPVEEKKKEIADTANKIAPPKPPAVSTNSSPIVKLGFANAVPGDPLHVTLPGEYASLGSISVERIDPAGNSLGSSWSRGTQMQIPNPKVNGGKIYFKVP